MIPPAGIFLDGFRLYLRALEIVVAHHDEERVADALAEAAALSAGRVQDEPAALLYAFAKRPRAVPLGWPYVVRCANNLARVYLRHRLVIDDTEELDMLTLGVMAGRVSFDEMRGFVAIRLRPLRDP